MKKVFSIVSAAVLALLALSCDRYEKAVFKASDATAPKLVSASAGKTVKVTYEPAVFNMSFNEKMGVYHTLGLIAIGQKGEGDAVEYTNVNQTLAGVKDDATNHVVSVSSDNLTTAMLARGFKYGDALQLKIVVRASIQDPSKGVTNGYVDSEDSYEFTFKLKKPSGGAYAAYTEESSWSVIGSIASTGNGWNQDESMMSNGTWHVCEALELTTSDQFKFRKDGGWDTNFGAGPDISEEPYVISLDTELPAGPGGKNLAVPADGVYDLLLNPDAALYKIVVHKEDPYAKYNQDSPWSVIGSIASTGNGWNQDEEMTTDGKWHLCRSLELAASDQFKFRKDGGWDTNFGAGPDITEEPYVVTLGQELPAGPGGKNLAVAEDGTYDLFLNPDDAVYKIVKAGEGAVEEPEQPKGIVIDGDGADWEGVEGVVSLTCADGAALTGIKSAKILYSDKIYLLMEISDAAVADGKVRLHMYFNGDNNSEGGLKQSWDNWDIDYMTEGKISNGGAYVSYEPSMYKWAGTQEDPWKWDTGNPIDVVSSGAGKGNVYEAELDYSCYPGGLADTFGFGIDIVDSSWATIGYLPNVAEGVCPKVTLTKQQ